MSRSFDAADMVVLPLLDVSSAITLGQALLTAADDVGKKHKLPKPIVKALGVFASRHHSLRVGAAERLGSAQSVDGTRAVMADRRVDAAWGAIHSWLAGWSKLPATLPQSSQAQTIVDDIFPEGLKFLTLPYKAEWAESDLRIMRIATQGHDGTITALGGSIFLDELHAAHTEYGEALGIKKAPAKPATEVNLRDALTAFRNALRSLVLRVRAHVEEDDAESVAFADALLAPLVLWTSTPKTADNHADSPTQGEAPKVEG